MDMIFKQLNIPLFYQEDNKKDLKELNNKMDDIKKLIIYYENEIKNKNNLIIKQVNVINNLKITNYIAYSLIFVIVIYMKITK